MRVIASLPSSRVSPRLVHSRLVDKEADKGAFRRHGAEPPCIGHICGVILATAVDTAAAVVVIVVGVPVVATIGQSPMPRVSRRVGARLAGRHCVLSIRREDREKGDER